MGLHRKDGIVVDICLVPDGSERSCNLLAQQIRRQVEDPKRWRAHHPLHVNLATYWLDVDLTSHAIKVDGAVDSRMAALTRTFCLLVCLF